MDIHKLREEYKKMRVPKMDISVNDVTHLEDFFQKIRIQDKEDEKFLLHNQIIPLIVGAFIMMILMLINPIKTLLMLTGMFLIFSALIISLILRFMDYKNISRGSYDLSLSSYLKLKKERLLSWHSTPSFYKWIFSVFVSGLIFMIIGNTSIISNFGAEYIFLFIAFYLIIFISAWTIGEHFFRRRHKRKHQPLIDNISDLLKELTDENKS